MILPSSFGFRSLSTKVSFCVLDAIENDSSSIAITGIESQVLEVPSRYSGILCNVLASTMFVLSPLFLFYC